MIVGAVPDDERVRAGPDARDVGAGGVLERDRRAGTDRSVVRRGLRRRRAEKPARDHAGHDGQVKTTRHDPPFLLSAGHAADAHLYAHGPRSVWEPLARYERRITVRPLLLLAAGVVLAAGCGGDDGDRARPPDSAAGPGLTVSEALESDAEGPLLVRGALHAREGAIRLCEALAESHPPQCAGPSLRVEGLSLSDVDGVRTAQGVSWTEGEVKLLGDLEGGALLVSDTAL